MNALRSYVPEFLNLCSNLECYTQQGMEKYNNITTFEFFGPLTIGVPQEEQRLVYEGSWL